MLPDVSVIEAREKALELKSQIAKGINPMEEKGTLSNGLPDVLSAELTFKELFDTYINEYGKYNIKRWRDRIVTMDSQGKHFYPTIEWELLEKNSVIGIKKHKEQSRDTYITKEEVPRFFQALEEDKNQLMKDFILISLYSGVRQNNVLSMRWENISIANKPWYVQDTKNGESQTVVLVDEAIKILQDRKE